MKQRNYVQTDEISEERSKNKNDFPLSILFHLSLCYCSPLHWSINKQQDIHSWLPLKYLFTWNENSTNELIPKQFTTLRYLSNLFSFINKTYKYFANQM